MSSRSMDTMSGFPAIGEGFDGFYLVVRRGDVARAANAGAAREFGFGSGDCVLEFTVSVQGNWRSSAFGEIGSVSSQQIRRSRR